MKEPEKEEICMGETLASSQIRVWNLRTINEGTAGRRYVVIT